MKWLVLLFSFISLGVASREATAALPKNTGHFGYWATWDVMEGVNPVCYMTITADPPVPFKDRTKTKRRGDVQMMIAHRPAEGMVDVVSYAPGAKFKAASDVTLKIDGNSFNLFTQGDTAWARDAATDRAIAMAIRAGDYAVLSGTLASGERLADRVSLKGSSKAYETISKSCGVTVLPLQKLKPQARQATKKSKEKTQSQPAKKVQ